MPIFRGRLPDAITRIQNGTVQGTVHVAVFDEPKRKSISNPYYQDRQREDPPSTPPPSGSNLFAYCRPMLLQLRPTLLSPFDISSLLNSPHPPTPWSIPSTLEKRALPYCDTVIPRILHNTPRISRISRIPRISAQGRYVATASLDRAVFSTNALSDGQASFPVPPCRTTETSAITSRVRIMSGHGIHSYVCRARSTLFLLMVMSITRTVVRVTTNMSRIGATREAITVANRRPHS